MSNKRIEINEQNLYIVVEIGDGKEVRLLHFSPFPYEEEKSLNSKSLANRRLVEVHCTGESLPIQLPASLLSAIINCSTGCRSSKREPSSAMKDKAYCQ
jgi:hypothetical protein